MLRTSIKYAISEALSAVDGYEVWDFDLKQCRDGDGICVEIRYRYDAALRFTALIVEGEHGDAITVDLEAEETEFETESQLEIAVEAAPGPVASRESFVVNELEELYGALTQWVARLDEEFAAAAGTRVLTAQQKALTQLGQHLDKVENRPLASDRLHRIRGRLERVEEVVAELRGEDDEDRRDEIREDFERLHECAELLGERDFLHFVLVRLVKHLWDEDNLRVVEGAPRAMQALFERAAAVARPTSRPVSSAPLPE